MNEIYLNNGFMVLMVCILFGIIIGILLLAVYSAISQYRFRKWIEKNYPRSDDEQKK
jgi:hypothetical protein